MVSSSESPVVIDQSMPAPTTSLAKTISASEYAWVSCPLKAGGRDARRPGTDVSLDDAASSVVRD
jgi:hypothetical protein